jgi:GAF domain-containing protein
MTDDHRREPCLRGVDDGGTVDAIAQLGTIVLNEQPLSAVMDKVARLAKQAILRAGEASITLIRDDRAYTASFTGRVAIELDERQYESRHGPCLDAAASGGTIAIDDTSNERTYVELAGKAAAEGVTSTLSVGLPVPQGTIGALNLYVTAPGGPFDETAVSAARTFAGYAAVALLNASLYADAVSLAEQLQQAMRSRAVIEQAKGILIRDNHCSADEAFAMLVKASNRSNRKLADIARSLVQGTQRGA